MKNRILRLLIAGVTFVSLLAANMYSQTPGGAGLRSGVSTLNGKRGDITLAAGSNVTITPSGNTFTIASTGGAVGTQAYYDLTNGAAPATPAGGSNRLYSDTGNLLHAKDASGNIRDLVWTDNNTDITSYSVSDTFGVRTDYSVISSNTTLDQYFHTVGCNAAGGAFQVTLIAPSLINGQPEYYIIKTDSSANAVTINGQAVNIVPPNATTITLTKQYQYVHLQYSGSAWQVINNITTADVPDLSATYVPTTRTVTAGTGLSGGGALSGNITLNVTGTTGTGTFSQYDAYKANGGESATYSDEFDTGSALNARWTKMSSWDLSEAVNTTTPGKLYLPIPTATEKFKGISQPIQSGDFTIIGEFTFINAVSAGYYAAGIYLADGTTDGAGKQVNNIIVQNTSGLFALAANYTNFNTGGTVFFNHTGFAKRTAFVKIRRSGSNYYFAYSPTGQDGEWYETAAKTTTDLNSITPTVFGITTDNNAAGITGIVTCNFFRYFAGNGNASLGGTRTFVTQ